MDLEQQTIVTGELQTAINTTVTKSDQVIFIIIPFPRGVVKSSSGESLGSGPCQSTHPYRLPGSAHSSTNSGSMISTSNSNSSLNHISCRSQQSPTQAGPGSGDFPLRKTGQ